MIGHFVVHLVLWLGVILMFIPLAWTLSTSLKPVSDVYLFPPKWIPNPVRWENYREAVTAIPFLTYLQNTVIITALSIIGKVASVTLWRLPLPACNGGGARSFSSSCWRP